MLDRRGLLMALSPVGTEGGVGYSQDLDRLECWLTMRGCETQEVERTAVDAGPRASVVECIGCVGVGGRGVWVRIEERVVREVGKERVLAGLLALRCLRGFAHGRVHDAVDEARAPQSDQERAVSVRRKARQSVAVGGGDGAREGRDDTNNGKGRKRSGGRVCLRFAAAACCTCC